MDLQYLKFIAVGLMSITMLGSALGIASIFSTLLSSIARNPSAESKLSKNAFIGAGLAEAMGLFGFLIALLLLFVV